MKTKVQLAISLFLILRLKVRKRSDSIDSFLERALTYYILHRESIGVWRNVSPEERNVETKRSERSGREV